MAFLEELMSSVEEGEKSKEFVYKLAEKHGLKPYEAENVWSFYRQDNRKIKICKGLPCSLKNSGAAGDSLLNGPDEGKEEVSCLGLCDHAPVAWSGGKYFQIEGDEPREINAKFRSYGGKSAATLNEFLAVDGFTSLLGYMKDKSGKNLLDFVKGINLRGFGGSGFPAWVKWNAVSDSEQDDKYLLVNAHEGEPGTFKDRIFLESRPFDLIEAAFIAARAVGAKNVVIALKHEYLDAEKILKDALNESVSFLKEKGVYQDISELRILRIPGYYVTGEESALMEAIEGRRSEPRLRPPYPAEVGLFGKPTLIDNVETLLYFLDRFREHLKTGNTTQGEKAYCLTGDVKNPGAYLLQYGSSSADLIKEKGGIEFSELKAVLPGGLSGGILPAEKGKLNLDFDSVKSAGAGMGTGAMIAISNHRCMVNVMGSVESFFERESCGKCMPCRYGTAELSTLFKNLSKGTATEEDLDSARETAKVMLKGSICGLGQASAKMFMDSVEYFKDEIKEHVSGKCASNTCFGEVK